MIRIYIRTSTGKQDIDTQRSSIHRYLKAHQIKGETMEYVDQAVSGKKVDKPELLLLLEEIKPNDVVIATELSRLTRRGVEDMVITVNKIVERGAKLIAIDQSFDFSTDLGKMVAAIFGYLAKIAHDEITARNRRMIEGRKAAGVQLGRKPKMSAEQIEQAAELMAKDVKTKTVVSTIGVSRQVLQNTMRRTIRTPAKGDRPAKSWWDYIQSVKEQPKSKE